MGAAKLGDVVVKRGIGGGLLSIACVVLAACGEPLEFADWTLPVPEGTRVVEYADVPDEERSETIELRPDLVLGDDPEDPNQAFFIFPQAKVGAGGRIFVLDGDNKRVQVFSPGGDYERTLGSSGQGPEELFRASSIAVTPDAIVVNDGGNSRYNVWRLDGTHERTYPAPAPTNLGRPIEFHSLGDDTFVGRHATYGPGDERGHLVARFSLAGEADEMFRYAERQSLFSLPSRNGSRHATVIAPSLAYTVGPASAAQPRPVAERGAAAVYVSARDQYQVLKYGPDNQLEWALRVARPPEPYPEADIEARLERLRARYPDISRSEFDWPQVLPALGEIATDGAGRLYVFPYVRIEAATPPPTQRAVDVYSPAGERIFAGWIRGLDRNMWTDALDDHVYASVLDAETEEWQIVRYRLVTPFE